MNRIEDVDFVRCRECGFEGKSLFRHLAKHGMIAEDYAEKYPEAKTVCDEMRDRRVVKLKSKPKKEPSLECRYCGGMFNGRVQRRAHERREEKVYLKGKDGVDYITCMECGFRETNLTRHISTWHGMEADEYREKYPDAQIVLGVVIDRQVGSNKGKHSKKTGEHEDSVVCDKCGDIYRERNRHYHWNKCIAENKHLYREGEEYVVCPECDVPMLRLGAHLRKIHGWNEDRVVLAGLQLMASCVVDRWKSKQDMQETQRKREETNLKRYGVKNQFSSKEVQEKIKETSRRRYGVDHAMQSEDVRIKQNESAKSGPSGQEVFFDEHTCDSVIYTGYGARFIRCKKGVEKYGRVIKDLNPDFMVFPDNVLESARSRSEAREKMNRERHRTRYVIELLGDYYHSEEVIGVDPDVHEQQVKDAYASAGIECLTLWEHDVMGRWNHIEPMVAAWIEKAVADINDNPVWRKPTRHKVDRRTAQLECPYGSGKKFKTQEKLDRWIESERNYYRPEMEEGRDYVVCQVCGGRFQKLTEHLRKSYGMSKEEYCELYPGSETVAEVVSDSVSESCRENPRRRRDG